MLAAAGELVAERGIADTTVAMIAARAKVGISSIYQYFSSKDALIDALVGEALARHAAAFARASEASGTAQEFSALAGAYVRFAAEEPVAARVLQAQGTAAPAAGGEHARTFLEGLVDGVERIVRSGDPGGGGERRHAATALLVAAMLGLGDLVSRTDGLAIHVDVAQSALARFAELAPEVVDAP